MILVKEVTLEHGLGRWVLQVDLILLDSVSVFPFLVVDMILIEVVVLLTWKVMGRLTTFMKGSPVKISKPWVLFDL